jgi:AcrR family transcriptional regulator
MFVRCRVSRINFIEQRIHQAAIRLFAEKGGCSITVSELAQAAGIARGTVYRNLRSPEALFETIAVKLSIEMTRRVVASFEGIDDPAQRLANGIRYFIRRAHEEPDWGRFVSRFAFGNSALQGTHRSPATVDVFNGMAWGVFQLRREQLPSAMALVAGTTLAAMLLVLEGHRTWRDASADAAELVLRGLGVPSGEAQRLAAGELPPLPLVSGTAPENAAVRAADHHKKTRRRNDGNQGPEPVARKREPA